jgi:hypothetical protein
MKTVYTTEAQLEIELDSYQSAFELLLDLPIVLRPTHHALGEADPGSPVLNATIARLSPRVSVGGFFLRNSSTLYSVRKSRNGNLQLDAYFDSEPGVVKLFMERSMELKPRFGFACTPDELRGKNCLITQIGVNAIEAWVGRNIERYVPGLYWITLLPNALIEKHGLDRVILNNAAIESKNLSNGQNMYVFYGEPKGWALNVVVPEISKDCAGIFKISNPASVAENVRSFLELSDALKNWR